MVKLKRITLVVFSGSKIPEEVLEGGTIFSTKIRLNAGTKRFAILYFSKVKRGRRCRIGRGFWGYQMRKIRDFGDEDEG